MLPRVHVVNSSQGSFLTFGNDVISNHLFTQDNWENWLLLLQVNSPEVLISL
jgi:hypothetical protein